LKEEALDRTMWRACFGRGFGPVVRQTTKWMNTRHKSVDNYGQSGYPRQDSQRGNNENSAVEWTDKMRRYLKSI